MPSHEVHLVSSSAEWNLHQKIFQTRFNNDTLTTDRAVCDAQLFIAGSAKVGSKFCELMEKKKLCAAKQRHSLSGQHLLIKFKFLLPARQTFGSNMK